MKAARLWLLIGWSLLAVAGCKKEEVYVAPDSSYGLIYTQIFAQSCALSGCHAAAAKPRDPAGFAPILEGEATYAALIGKRPENLQARNSGLTLIQANDPDASFLYQKVIYDSSAYPFGAKMPSGGLQLTTNQILFLRQWIVAGAPLNGHVADRNLIQ